VSYASFRYNKFSRDVPQSPWSLTPTGNEEANDDIEVGDDPSRKGRNSVEEIIAFYFFKEVECSACTLHGCGREDIDVRCLGNGRPFCLQILEAKHTISSSVLEKISGEINGKLLGTLNEGGDIAVSHLSLVIDVVNHRPCRLLFFG
jgi:tRNA pseudouridine synthase 10